MLLSVCHEAIPFWHDHLCRHIQEMRPDCSGPNVRFYIIYVRQTTCEYFPDTHPT